MEIRTRYLGSVVCLDVQGRLVVTEDDRLKERVSHLLLENHRKIVLNLQDVLQLDTTGLTTLVAVRHLVDRNGGQIKLLNVPPRVHDLLVVTRLITLFELVDSESDAERAFSVEENVH